MCVCVSRFKVTSSLPQCFNTETILPIYPSPFCDLRLNWNPSTGVRRNLSDDLAHALLQPGWYSQQGFYATSSLGGTLVVCVRRGWADGRFSVMNNKDSKLDLFNALGARSA